MGHPSRPLLPRGRAIRVARRVRRRGRTHRRGESARAPSRGVDHGLPEVRPATLRMDRQRDLNPDWPDWQLARGGKRVLDLSLPLPLVGRGHCRAGRPAFPAVRSATGTGRRFRCSARDVAWSFVAHAESDLHAPRRLMTGFRKCRDRARATGRCRRRGPRRGVSRPGRGRRRAAARRGRSMWSRYLPSSICEGAVAASQLVLPGATPSSWWPPSGIPYSGGHGLRHRTRALVPCSRVVSRRGASGCRL